MKNVIYDVVYIRSESKVSRMHHRFLGKKRQWLTRQIDPTKRYLHMLKKQETMQEEEIDEDEDESVPIEDTEQPSKSEDPYSDRKKDNSRPQSRNLAQPDPNSSNSGPVSAVQSGRRRTTMKGAGVAMSQIQMMMAKSR